jgi:hypothetical protein
LFPSFLVLSLSWDRRRGGKDGRKEGIATLVVTSTWVQGSEVLLLPAFRLSFLERTDGRTEGKKNGRKEGRTDGRKDGRKEGRKEGRTDGRKEGYIENMQMRWGERERNGTKK